MLLKKIIPIILCISLLCTSSFAFTPFFPEEEQTNSSSSQNPVTVHPDEYYSYAFYRILDLYVDNHLYDFSKEEALDAFLKKLLNENPYLFKYLVNTLLSTMDPYSSYHEASSHFLDVEKASAGFGFMISEDENGAFVKSVLRDSNASLAGFEAGDRFVSIAGYNVEGLPLDAVSAILQRPYIFASKKDENGKYENTNPVCEFIMDRGGEQVVFNINRGPMTQEQIQTTLVNEDTAYIQIMSFLEPDMDVAFNELVRNLENQGIKNLTIDLRDNGGGVLQYAISMAETFLEYGDLICYYNDKNQSEPKPVYSTTHKVNFESVTVLVNQNSASAAELFANILQTKNAAKIIGTKTYGKAIGQSVYTFANGDYITITTYQMLDSNLETYNEVGIIPDIEIENVKLLYILPEMEHFNHQNFVEIKEGEFSKPSLALEQRLNVMGLLFEKDVDGIFDEKTKNALIIYQKIEELEATGVVDKKTVSSITKTINGYKTHTYFEDSQYDVANIVHESFSQGKRLKEEKLKLAEKNKKLIEEAEQKLLDELDAKENNV